jgi:hypothetical protein
MTMDARIVITGWAVLLVSTQAAAYEIRYEWNKVPGAAYYQGEIEYGSSLVTVRTESEWLLLPQGTSIKLEGFDEANRVVSEALIIPHPKEIAPLKPLVNSVQMPADAIRGSDQNTGKMPETQTSLPAAQGKLKKKTKSKHRSNISLGIYAGLGRDQLTSKGGVGGYNGVSNIAPLTLDGSWRALGLPLMIVGSISLHYFNVSNQIESISNSDVAEKKDRFVRQSGWVGGMYKIIGGRRMPHDFSLGGGLSYISLPALKVNDTSTGSASLGNTALMRLSVKSTYKFQLTPSQGVGSRISYAFFAFPGPLTSEGSALGIFWSYAADQNNVLNVEIASSLDTVSQRSTCDDSISCQPQSTASSRVTALQVGYQHFL